MKKCILYNVQWLWGENRFPNAAFPPRHRMLQLGFTTFQTIFTKFASLGRNNTHLVCHLKFYSITTYSSDRRLTCYQARHCLVDNHILLFHSAECHSYTIMLTVDSNWKTTPATHNQLTSRGILGQDLIWHTLALHFAILPLLFQISLFDNWQARLCLVCFRPSLARGDYWGSAQYWT